MMLKIPKSKYSNYYDVARFNLTWNFSIIMLVFLSVLAIVFYISGNKVALPVGGGIALSILSLALLIRTKAYFYSALAFCFVGLFLCIYVLNFFPNSSHFANPFWMMLIGIYSFFTLGKKWGAAALIAAMLGLAYYAVYNYSDNIAGIQNPTKGDTLALALNLIISLTLNIFLIIKFISLNQVAEEESVLLTKELKEKNNEKTVLLKEVHHRVKNNLQVIISLMRLKSHGTSDDTEYSDTIDRIRSMSLIHEKIYQSKDLAKIDLKDYIETLAQDLIDSYSIDTKVTLDIHSNVKTLKTKSLVPIALIFNELISNSIKHGFRNKETGIIRIFIDDKIPSVKMEYSDSGVWVENNSPNSLGLELIQSLTEQLTGSFYRDVKDDGTYYSFKFKYDDQ